MASLVLGAVGQAVGPSLFGAGISIFGATITGAEIGGAIGALAGSLIDSALMPGQHIVRQGPRLSDINVQSSTEGAPIPRVFGRIRVAGQLIWASKFKETAATTNTGGGKGFGSSVKVTETDYTYSISFAVGLCAGVTTRIGRVWADGKLVDLAQFTIRFYKGDETQSFDPLIEEIEGEGNTPAYRGLSYIVFEDMPLAQFGNRIPQLQFEIIRSISSDKPDALENRLTGVTLIPGAGEFIYADEIVMADDGEGTTSARKRPQFRWRIRSVIVARRIAGDCAQYRRGIARLWLVRKRPALRLLRNKTRRRGNRQEHLSRNLGSERHRPRRRSCRQPRR